MTGPLVKNAERDDNHTHPYAPIHAYTPLITPAPERLARCGVALLQRSMSATERRLEASENPPPKVASDAAMRGPRSCMATFVNSARTEGQGHRDRLELHLWAVPVLAYVARTR